MYALFIIRLCMIKNSLYVPILTQYLLNNYTIFNIISTANKHDFSGEPKTVFFYI